MPSSDTVQAAWDEAKKICSFCPVASECRRDTLGEEYGVWGGLDEHERYLVRSKPRHRRSVRTPQGHARCRHRRTGTDVVGDDGGHPHQFGARDVVEAVPVA